MVEEYPPGWKKPWRPPTWVIGVVVAVLAVGAALLAWNTFVGTTTTKRIVPTSEAGPGSIVRAATSCEKGWVTPLPGVVVVPSSRTQGCWSCGDGLPTTGYFTAAAIAHGYQAPPLPKGDRVRVTTHWLRPTEYRFVADDGTTVALHAMSKFWCVARAGGP